MKKLLYIIPIVSLFALVGCSADQKPVAVNDVITKDENRADSKQLLDGLFGIDTKNSVIKWKGEMIAVKTHTGTIGIKSGFFNVLDGRMSGGEIISDMTTIGSDEGLDTLVTHLSSADFFDAEQFPESKLIIKSLEDIGGDNYNVNADLTIKGITKPVVLNAQIRNTLDGNLEFESDFEIDRTLWNVRYGSDKFFDNLEDKIIKDEIVYNITIKAIK